VFHTNGYSGHGFGGVLGLIASGSGVRDPRIWFADSCIYGTFE